MAPSRAGLTRRRDKDGSTDEKADDREYIRGTRGKIEDSKLGLLYCEIKECLPHLTSLN